ncbi:MAG: PIN domain-containing protein [Candidatus Dadabacteria bacterium]|nr:PIN domain-containing protein [Candidatus Dadabacteria bacterium]MCY4047456.1 PIN domain-containing protein [Candidatus Dadabacteria bacterium]
MSVESLLDTNVVIYIVDTDNPEKTAKAEQLVRSGTDYGDCCISRQVIQETLNVATKKFSYSPEEAGHLLERTLLPLYQETSAPSLYRRGLDIQFRYNYGFYDSVIIAAALELGCKTLYSEDMQHGQKIERLTIENPFR